MGKDMAIQPKRIGAILLLNYSAFRSFWNLNTRVFPQIKPK